MRKVKQEKEDINKLTERRKSLNRLLGLCVRSLEIEASPPSKALFLFRSLLIYLSVSLSHWDGENKREKSDFHITDC